MVLWLKFSIFIRKKEKEKYINLKVSSNLKTKVKFK